MGSGLSRKYRNTYGSALGYEDTNSVREEPAGYGSSPSVLRVSSGTSSINENVAKMQGKFAPNEHGNFGVQGKNTRVIKCDDPIKDSATFYDRIGKGGKLETIPGKEGTVTTLDDNSKITYRIITTTEGSPAVQINVKNVTTGIKNQKIHFIKE